mmetsp:Transcript_44973/g.95913  ORF Transcript_44973/g.95913 Transcript_44973/m.95913 type:complete len:915 (-) Transcript_44973:333-3077(-)
MVDQGRLLLLGAFLGLSSSAASPRHPPPKCPGSFDVAGFGRAELIPTGWNVSGATSVDVHRPRSALVAHMDSRAYFAETCNAGHYSNKDYIALNLLGKVIRFTVDISGTDCGCNAAFYLTNMRQNEHVSECFDHYCDANNVCGESCAEIDLMEANKYAFHSTLHTKMDRDGQTGGYGGGDGWNGPRDWLGSQYGPDGVCVDTSKPFDVQIAFPVDNEGVLHAMDVELSQQGKNCPLSVRLSQYPGMADLTRALSAGMTPIVSYWKSSKMLWMDGQGADGTGPCAVDRPKACSDTVSISNFSIAVWKEPRPKHTQHKGQAHQHSVTHKVEPEPARKEHPACPGDFQVDGHGKVSLVPFGWKAADAAHVEVTPRGHVLSPRMGSRGYFADTCVPGVYNHSQYLALKLLGKTLSYTVDISGATCGCNAAVYLVSMHWNKVASECSDYYCDANSVCGESCAEIGIQEANRYAWHSTLHTKYDHTGLAGGYGGGSGWNGPRDWSRTQYGPGGVCVDTSKSFEVMASFPTDAAGQLAAMEVKLSQEGKACDLRVRLGNYMGEAELSRELARGMTPVISYWSWDKMFWMDGPGTDGKGPCQKDLPDRCADYVKLTNFKIEDVKLDLTPEEKEKLATEKVKCIGGWLRPTECVEKFLFKGVTVEGCTTIADGIAADGWCSRDSMYQGRWSRCEACEDVESEEEVLPAEEQLIKHEPRTQSSPATAKLYEQCKGGPQWKGPSVCEEGTTCKWKNDYYGQCEMSNGCVGGWKASPSCIPGFVYNDERYVACTTVGMDGQGWCSWDARYMGRSSNCTRCSEGKAVPVPDTDVALESSLGPAEEELSNVILKKDLDHPVSLPASATGRVTLVAAIACGLAAAAALTAAIAACRRAEALPVHLADCSIAISGRRPQDAEEASAGLLA